MKLLSTKQKVQAKNKLRQRKMKGKLCCSIAGITIILYLVFLPFFTKDESTLSFLDTLEFSSPTASLAYIDYHVDIKCTNLPTIKPSGAFFLNTKSVKKALSPETVTPQFYIGSKFGDKVRDHMTTDEVHFKLIKKLLQSKGNKEHGGHGRLTFDLGANQGFFTYYLAALGMDVHSFEISQTNFLSLQHGQYYNTKEIADRVNLYPIGMDNKVSRFDLSGSNYDAFLKQGKVGSSSSGSSGNEGSILGVSFDCFAHHSKLDLSHVAFVKIDVEGFEIAVLMGASNSLFRKENKNGIGGMLMEVGPDRWDRANIDLDTGINVMAEVSLNNFKNSYILIRAAGSHVETCPVSLAEGVLSDTKPETIDGKVEKHEVQQHEWKPLLTKMKEKHYDCNFWYTN